MAGARTGWCRFCGVGEGRGSARDGGGVKTNYWFGGGFTG